VRSRERGAQGEILASIEPLVRSFFMRAMPRTWSIGREKPLRLLSAGARRPFDPSAGGGTR